MSSEERSRLAQELGYRLRKKASRLSLAADDRCIVCKEPVDPFTKCAYVEPSTICIDCRTNAAETAANPAKAA